MKQTTTPKEVRIGQYFTSDSDECEEDFSAMESDEFEELLFLHSMYKHYIRETQHREYHSITSTLNVVSIGDAFLPFEDAERGKRIAMENDMIKKKLCIACKVSLLEVAPQPENDIFKQCVTLQLFFVFENNAAFKDEKFRNAFPRAALQSISILFPYADTSAMRRSLRALCDSLAGGLCSVLTFGGVHRSSTLQPMWYTDCPRLSEFKEKLHRFTTRHPRQTHHIVSKLMREPYLASTTFWDEAVFRMLLNTTCCGCAAGCIATFAPEQQIADLMMKMSGKMLQRRNAEELYDADREEMDDWVTILEVRAFTPHDVFQFAYFCRKFSVLRDEVLLNEYIDYLDSATRLEEALIAERCCDMASFNSDSCCYTTDDDALKQCHDFRKLYIRMVFKAFSREDARAHVLAFLPVVRSTIRFQFHTPSPAVSVLNEARLWVRQPSALYQWDSGSVSNDEVFMLKDISEPRLMSAGEDACCNVGGPLVHYRDYAKLLN